MNRLYFVILANCTWLTGKELQEQKPRQLTLYADIHKARCIWLLNWNRADFPRHAKQKLTQIRCGFPAVIRNYIERGVDINL